MAEYISERTVGRLIGDSIRIFAKNYFVIILIYLLPVFPFIFLKSVASDVGEEGLFIVSNGLQVMVAIFTTGAVTIAVSDICLGNKPSLTRSYAAVFQVFWRYLGTYALYLLVVLIGVMLLVIPGIYAILVLIFILPVCIIERRSAVDAMKRSRALGKGYYLRNFGVLLLGSLAVVLIAGLFGVGVGFAFGMAEISATSFLFIFLVDLISALISPLVQVLIILLYYDMRVRKENFDGTALAQELMT